MNQSNMHAPIRPQEYHVPDHAKIVRCKSCGAEIIWTKTSKNGRAIPLSVALIRIADNGDCVALPHFVDCPNSTQHRRTSPPQSIALDFMDLPAYLRQHNLVVIANRISDDGDGRLIVELMTRKA